MRIMVFFDQHQNVVNVDFNLTDQFDFKDNVVCNILFADFRLMNPFIAQILIATEIILHIAFGKNFPARKFVEGGKQVAHTQNGTKEKNEILLAFFADDLRLGERELGF